MHSVERVRRNRPYLVEHEARVLVREVREEEIRRPTPWDRNRVPRFADSALVAGVDLESKPLPQVSPSSVEQLLLRVVIGHEHPHRLLLAAEALEVGVTE